MAAPIKRGNWTHTNERGESCTTQAKGGEGSSTKQGQPAQHQRWKNGTAAPPKGEREDSSTTHKEEEGQRNVARNKSNFLNEQNNEGENKIKSQERFKI